MYVSLLESTTKLNICGHTKLLNPTVDINLAHDLGQILAPGQGLANASRSLAHWLKKGQQTVTLLVHLDCISTALQIPGTAGTAEKECLYFVP